MMRLRVGVCWTEAEKATIVAQAIFSPDADVVLGNGPPATLNVADWVGPPVLVIAGSTGHVHLAPGMRVNMCRSDGSERLVGTYEELLAAGVPVPVPIAERAMNIRVRPELSVFARYLRPDEPDFAAASE